MLSKCFTPLQKLSLCFLQSEDFIFPQFVVQCPPGVTKQFLILKLLRSYLLYCASIKFINHVNKLCYELTGRASISERVKELPRVIKPSLSLSLWLWMECWQPVKSFFNKSILMLKFFQMWEIIKSLHLLEPFMLFRQELAAVMD